MANVGAEVVKPLHEAQGPQSRALLFSAIDAAALLMCREHRVDHARDGALFGLG